MPRPVSTVARQIPHHAFYAALASAEEGSAQWRALTAGLLTLRLAASRLGGEPYAPDVRLVAAALALVDEGDAARAALGAVIDAATDSRDARALGPALMGYGRALDFGGAWPLAEEAYACVAEHAHPTREGDLAVDAQMRRAYCARMCGRHDAAAAAYDLAARIAQENGDAVRALHAQIGHAKLALERGNLPEAERVLDGTIRRARAAGHADVHAVALHDRAHVAHLRGEHERAVRFAYDALGRTRASAERDRVLSDLAGFFGVLGVRDVSRDAFIVLAATAQEQFVRWTATINLLEIAAQDGRRDAFDLYRRELEAAALAPIHRAQYLLHLGQGLARFGERKDAARALDETVAVAEAHRFNQIAFAAHASRASLGTPGADAPARAEPAGLADVADAVRTMRREVALAGAPGASWPGAS